MHLQLLLSVATLAAASPVLSRRDAPKVLQYAATVQRKTASNSSATKDSLMPVDTWAGISIPLYVGSQHQEVPMALDTGNWLSWVSNQHYNINSSITATKLATEFHFIYPGQNLTGWHYNDTFANSPDGDEQVYIGFGYADAGTIWEMWESTGSLGLVANPVPENDYVGQLKEAGYIESRSFGFWLADKDHGSVTFGGVDISKAASDFTKVPIFGSLNSILVQKFKGELNGQEILVGEGNKYACILDSTVYSSNIPTDIFNELARAFDFVWTNNNTEAIANNMANDNWSIKYQGGGSIKLDSSGYELELPLWRFLTDANYEIFSAEPQIGKWYNLNLAPGGEGTYSCLLGAQSIFMEYVIVFDHENANIAFANSNKSIPYDYGPSSLSAIGTEGLDATFAPSTQLATNGTDFTVYSTAPFTAS